MVRLCYGPSLLWSDLSVNPQNYVKKTGADLEFFRMGGGGWALNTYDWLQIRKNVV